MITLISQRVREKGHHKSDCLEQNYIEYFRKFGFDLVPVPNLGKDIGFYFKLPLERIILTGGGDLGDKISKKRDYVEKNLLGFAIENKIPVLGICRGMQMINNYFGGKLQKIRNKIHVNKIHEIKIFNEELKELTGEFIWTNSFHDWGINEQGLASQLKSFATSSDGFIEGLYHSDLPIGGIQWHPERENPNNKSDYIIMAFLNKGLFWKK